MDKGKGFPSMQVVQFSSAKWPQSNPDIWAEMDSAQHLVWLLIRSAELRIYFSGPQFPHLYSVVEVMTIFPNSQGCGEAKFIKICKVLEQSQTKHALGG